MNYDLLQVGLGVLAVTLLTATGFGFLVRLWVHHRRIAFTYDQLHRWERALTYVRWGSYAFLWVAMIAAYGEWPSWVMLGGLFASIITLVFSLRARAIVRVWLEQLDAGQVHLT